MSNSALGSQTFALLQLPSGMLMDYAGTVEPIGWLLCDGRAVSRTGAFASLFQAIGTAYGVGDGSSTFNIPDFRGRFARYNDDMGTAQNPAFVDKTSVNAGSFVVGRKYKITFVGTTSFTSIGASANTVGIVFTATGLGSGTGTADEARVPFTAQAQATAKNGLSNSTSSTTVSGSAIGGTHGHDLGSAGNYDGKTATEGEHFHGLRTTNQASNSPGAIGESNRSVIGGFQNTSTFSHFYSYSNTYGVQWVDSQGNHKHSIEVNPTNSHTHPVSGTGTAAAQTITGDPETRPINLACNKLIKL